MTGKQLQEHYENLDENEIYEFLDLMAAWMPSDEWDYLVAARMKVEERRKRG